MTPKAESGNTQTEMPFLEHIEELRSRLLIIIVALLIGSIIGSIFTQQIIKLLAQPVGGLENLQSIEVTENVGVFMRVALTSGVLLAMPVVVYQLLMFVVPGLLPNERKWVYLAVPFATILFAGGVAFTYFVLLPPAVNFLLQFLGVTTTPRISNYIGFITNLMFWIGISFETPLLIFILARLKVVKGKQLLKGWRIAVVMAAIMAAVITPTVDPVNMGLLMLPMIGLYLISVGLAFLAG